jgi:Flp pilus assembly protein TadD
VKKVVFVGNCQGRRLEVLYREKFAPITGDEASFVGSFDDLSPEKRAVLAEADVIVSQAIEGEHDVAIGRFETDAKIIEYPNVTGVFLWPYSGGPHILNYPLPDLQDGPFGDQFGDRWLNKKIASGAKPADICAEYEALDVAKAVRLDRMYELIMQYLRRGDARTGFDLAPTIESSFTEEALFLTPANLELKLFRPLASGIYERLGIPANSVSKVLDTVWRTPFPVLHHPIHPSVARHFGLKYIRPETRYRMLSGEAVSFSEWVARYVRFDWNNELLDGTRKIHAVGHFDAQAQSLLDQVEHGMARTNGSVSGESARAHLYFLKGDIAAAAAAARRAAALDPSDPQLVGTLAFHLIDQEQGEEAERLMRETTEKWPNNVQGWRSFGIILLRRGKPQEAIQSFHRAVTLDSRDVDSARHLANALVGVGATDQALSMLAVAAAINPEAADLFSDLAFRLHQAGDLDSALIAVRRAVALDPDSVERQRHLAEILAARGDEVGAEVAWRRLAAIERRRPLPADLQSSVDEALDRHRQALRRRPNDSDLRRALAENLAEHDFLEEAESVLAEGLAMDPFDATLHGALVVLLELQGRRREAEASAEKAAQLAPGDARHLKVLAKLRDAAGKLEAAEASYLAAIELAPDDAELRALIEFLRSRMGRRTVAAE